MKILVGLVILGLLAMLVRVVTMDFEQAFPTPTPTPYEVEQAVRIEMSEKYAASPTEATAECLVRLRDAGDAAATRMIGTETVASVAGMLAHMPLTRYGRHGASARTGQLTGCCGIDRLEGINGRHKHTGTTTICVCAELSVAEAGRPRGDSPA